MVATCAGIPYEIYELVAKVTPLRLTAFVINVALVVYLVLSKRLFGARGGKKAYDARLRSESVLQAAVDAAAAARGRRRSDGPPGPPGAGAGRHRSSEAGRRAPQAGGRTRRHGRRRTRAPGRPAARTAPGAYAPAMSSSAAA